MASSLASAGQRAPGIRRVEIEEGLVVGSARRPVCGGRLQNMAFCICQSHCNLRPKIYLSGYLISSPLISQGPKLLGMAEPEALLLFLPLSLSLFLLFLSPSFLKVCLQGFPGGCPSLVMIRHHSDLLLP